MNKLILAIAVILLITGCSTTLSDRQVEAMNTPTLTLDCKTGCSASYTDPRDRPSMPTNGWDVANTAINAASGVVSSTAPWAAIGYTAAEGIKNAVGDDNSDNSVRTDDNSSRDNSVVNNDDNRTFDSTHEPTVVTTPSPEIVRPEIVRPEVVTPRPINASNAE